METWTPEQWSEWLNAVFRGDVVVPRLGGDSEPHLDLIDVFDRLPSLGARQAFAEGVGRTFEQITVNGANTPFLYTLLHLLAYTHPANAVDRLRYHLFVGTFRHVDYEGAPLHTLLLETVGEYPLTNEVIDYIKRSVPRSADADYHTAAMRVLAVQDRRTSLDLLLPSIARLNRREDVSVIASHLKGFVASYGYEGVYEWSLSNGDRLIDRAGRAMEWLVDALVVHGVIDSPVRATEGEPFRPIVSATVNSAMRDLRPQEVLALASVAEDLPGQFAPIFERIMLQHRARGTRISLWSVFGYAEDEKFILRVGTQQIEIESKWQKELDFLSVILAADEPTPDDVNTAIHALSEKIQQMSG